MIPLAIIKAAGLPEPTPIDLAEIIAEEEKRWSQLGTLNGTWYDDPSCMIPVDEDHVHQTRAVPLTQEQVPDDIKALAERRMNGKTGHWDVWAQPFAGQRETWRIFLRMRVPADDAEFEYVIYQYNPMTLSVSCKEGCKDLIELVLEDPTNDLPR